MKTKWIRATFFAICFAGLTGFSQQAHYESVIGAFHLRFGQKAAPPTIPERDRKTGILSYLFTVDDGSAFNGCKATVEITDSGLISRISATKMYSFFDHPADGSDAVEAKEFKMLRDFYAHKYGVFRQMEKGYAKIFSAESEDTTFTEYYGTDVLHLMLEMILPSENSLRAGVTGAALRVLYNDDPLYRQAEKDGQAYLEKKAAQERKEQSGKLNGL